MPEVVHFEQPFAAAFADVHVVPEAGLCLVSEDHAWTDVSMNDAAVFEAALNRHWRDLRTLHQDRTPVIDEPVGVLTHAYAGNYYHWHVECLGRIEGLRHYEAANGCRLKLLVPPMPPAWMRETWEAVGYSERDIVIPDSPVVQCKRAVLVSSRRHGKAAAPAVCRWLKNSLQASGAERDGGASRGIYVSRRKAATRHVLNEGELIAALAKLAIVDLAPETLSFEDQVRVFSQASLVVSPFGSGLTNILYATDARVIELRGRDYNPTLRYLAAACGHEYRLVECARRGGDLVVDSRAVVEAVGEAMRNGR